MAEGEKVIRRALHAGFRMRSLLLEDKWLASLGDVVDTFDGPVYVAARPVLAELTGYDVHRGALAAMDRKALPSVAEVLSTASRIAVHSAPAVTVLVWTRPVAIAHRAIQVRRESLESL